jgi:DNA-binding MarR family transcriptional regulator
VEEYKNITMYEACLLHSKADRALRLVVSRQLDSFELSMMEWLLLATVCDGPPTGITMTQAAGTLDVTLPQVTALMNDLVKMKLVKQKVSKTDKRSRKLLCTTQGKRLLGEIEKAIAVAMRQWLDGIPREQLYAYITTVGQLANRKTE